MHSPSRTASPHPIRQATSDTPTSPAPITGAGNVGARTVGSRIVDSGVVWPGLLVCAVAGLGCLGVNRLVPSLSAMLAAVVLGALWRNLVPVPSALEPGIATTAKHVLRWGVVLLGLQLSLPRIVQLGLGLLLVVVAAVGVTFVSTLAIGRALRVDRDLTLLIAGGFSICGAAAVAGIQGAAKATQEKVAAAVALVVLFGSVMIGVMPALVALLRLRPGDAGTLIGGGTHEVAQVVAAAGIAGGGTILAVAVPVKLARVVLMAPVVALVSVVRHRNARRLDARPVETGTQVGSPSGTASRTSDLPPLVPGFVLGFLAMVLVVTAVKVPVPVLTVAASLQQFLLASAMFALGLGVHLRSLVRLGFRAVVLGLCSTVTIVGVLLAGIALGLGARA